MLLLGYSLFQSDEESELVPVRGGFRFQRLDFVRRCGGWMSPFARFLATRCGHSIPNMKEIQGLCPSYLLPAGPIVFCFRV
jgi:hypothetical protein